jgi:hypothetical protein
MTESNRYEHGKIYKVWSNQTDKVYIGYTTKKTLAERMTAHRYEYKNKSKEGNRACNEILQHGDAKIELLELYPCFYKDELTARAGHYMRLFDNSVNKRLEGRSIQEWRKTYYKNNKEEIQEYYEEHGKKYRATTEYKERKKAYDIQYNAKIDEQIKQEKLKQEQMKQEQAHALGCEATELKAGIKEAPFLQMKQ